jgi:hypothetical protein
MIRNQYYYSVASPQGPVGPAGTSIATPNHTTVNAVATWADATGTSLGDSSLLIHANNDNISIGNDSPSVTSGQKNVSCGTLSLQNLTTGDNNVAVGFASLGQVIDDTGNIAIGLQAGLNYTGNESYNILIGNYGTVGDMAIIRIGNSDQNKLYIPNIIKYENTNTFLGNDPTSITSGAGSSCVGYLSSQSITIGNTYCALGYGSLRSIQGGTKCIGIGVYVALITLLMNLIIYVFKMVELLENLMSSGLVKVIFMQIAL